MDLKFYLNKFVKVDNIEHFTLKTLFELKKRYTEFLEKSEGIDPDFPTMEFGDNKKGVQNFKSNNNITKQTESIDE